MQTPMYQDPDDRGLQWWQETSEAIAYSEMQSEEQKRADSFAEEIFRIGCGLMLDNVKVTGAPPTDASKGDAA